MTETGRTTQQSCPLRDWMKKSTPAMLGFQNQEKNLGNLWS